jgi:hypothetical protein
VAAVLASEMFKRAPKLSRLLCYLNARILQRGGEGPGEIVEDTED